MIDTAQLYVLVLLVSPIADAETRRMSGGETKIADAFFSDRNLLITSCIGGEDLRLSLTHSLGAASICTSCV
jgi:hypothetical protein